MSIVTYLQMHLASFLRTHTRSERGAALVEYALLVALIAVVCIAAITFLGQGASARFSDVGSKVGPTP